MIYISSSPVLAPAFNDPDAIDGRNPRIGWRNLITMSNIAATSSDPSFPVTHLGNSATFLRWKAASTAGQALTVTLSAAEFVNYFALASHNFGSTGTTYVLQYSTDGTNWINCIDARIPTDDFVLFHEFNDVIAKWFRLLITPGSSAPSIAVFYLGSVLRLQRRIYVGHTPIVYGRRYTVSNNYSENGQFLGRVLRRKMLATSVSMSNITPEFYRASIDPFFVAAAESPFFFSWRPSQYPREVAYGWLSGNPEVSNQRANGMMQIGFSMQAIP